jgi:hypothetical protein
VDGGNGKMLKGGRVGMNRKADTVFAGRYFQ